MSSKRVQNPKVKMIVTRPGTKAVIVYEENTRQLLLFTETYIKNVEPGVYEDEEIVPILKELATRGHETVAFYNPKVLFKMILPFLLSNLPFLDKYKQLMKLIRASIKPK